MAVLLPDGRYGLLRRSRPAGRDAHGAPVPTAPAPATQSLPGAAVVTDTGGWRLRLDPALWPVREGDQVVRAGDGARWTVTGVPTLHSVPGHSGVDHVVADAVPEPTEPDRGLPV